jgi:phenylpropionate dioxygenase-like ring-hydroxylating dioxygenase large terminal subunit
VVFRGPSGEAVALQDRCMHRAGRLSRGAARDGCVVCPYHGWTYGPGGRVEAVPAEGEAFTAPASRRALAFRTCERDGLVFVRLDEEGEAQPWPSPAWGQPGYRTVRLINRFQNDVTNCAENFIDVPHTVSVHPGIFRTARRQRLRAVVRRADGRVEADYQGETDNLGWFAWFLNPSGAPFVHVDRFLTPNVTSVEYRFGPNRHLFITSHCVPVRTSETLVYTDLTYNFGWLSMFAGPILRFQGQRVIDQDVVALAQQQEVLDRYGAKFANTPADIVHVLVESLREAVARGEDPRALPDREHTVDMWV